MGIKIETIAKRLNNLASGYEIEKLQDIRKEIKGFRRKHTSSLFSPMTIFDEYAYHDGGRTEIQYINMLQLKMFIKETIKKIKNLNL